MTCCTYYYVIYIFPLFFDFDVGFIHTPSVKNCSFILTKYLIQKRHYADTPAVKRGFINMNDYCIHLEIGKFIISLPSNPNAAKKF